jgi:hypothetical protein
MIDNPQVPPSRIQVQHHRKTLDVRAVDRIIQDSQFSEAWQYATVKQRTEVLRAISECKSHKVKAWVAEIMIGTLDRCNMITLKTMARRRQIPRYSQLTKAQLIDALQGRA